MGRQKKNVTKRQFCITETPVDGKTAIEQVKKKLKNISFSAWVVQKCQEYLTK